MTAASGAVAFVAAALLPWWPVRLVAGLVGAGLLVRLFSIYHDYMHGAILRDSWLARVVLHSVGVLLLAPPRSWRASHDFHHGHVGEVEGSAIGSFPLMTTDDWQRATAGQRLAYRLSRSFLVILCAHVTVFLYSICARALVADPRRHWDSGLALVLHGVLIALVWWLLGGAGLCFVFPLPQTLAYALGAYLFYVQHNFVGVRMWTAAEWGYERGALESSSYLKLGPVLRRVTGNLGFHHVHHLNPRIPFYRLPEAMAAVPELQRPVVTTLRPRAILACLRLKLWDTVQGRMVGFAAAPVVALDRAAQGRRGQPGQD